ncbi:hypothetical protein DPMN_059255 [Dreissena polymorpha]|uniref:Uncharacterized protein n=1 Tax=Dreissena polymorpha TaxID=45954 RepID=A0A9D4C378_DREPO|nr:hypothetical protein DPMN_059255 [Dreissena polymorpha]
MARQSPTRIPTPNVGNVTMHKVQYQLEVNCLKDNFGLVWPMWTGRSRIDRIIIREVQYQLEVNRCRNEKNSLCGRGAQGLVMGPCIVEIDRIVIREVQYQLEVNRCRNEEIIVKGNFGWVWSIWAGRPRIDRIVIRKVQYQFEVNRCNFRWVWSMWAGRPRIDRIFIREVQYQFCQGSSAYSAGGDSGQDGRTDRRTAEITTISPCFSKSVGIPRVCGHGGLTRFVAHVN